MTTQQQIDQLNEKMASLQAEVAALKAPQNAAVEPEKPRIDGFWEPKVGDEQWYLRPSGEIGYESSYSATLRDKMMVGNGNSFPSHEAAQMAFLRRQSMRIDWVPKRGDEYHIWQKDGSSMIYKWGSDVEFDKMALAL